MREAVIAEVSTQLSEVVGVIERHLEPTLLAVHLYGSAVDGGLKPHSDIDLLVTVTVRLDETTRRALINDLLETSASPGGHCCKVSDEAAFCLIQRPYISKTLLT
ncbi:nucleotidyltransferase domain-containing protein, partial [Escherichia coli]|nr:nucleotidyltransferase domain-containing protein [Escherichia coli]MCK2799912.1 nucleotidyltransferase domain-containing protein [Escherichia coli]